MAPLQRGIAEEAWVGAESPTNFGKILPALPLRSPLPWGHRTDLRHTLLASHRRPPGEPGDVTQAPSSSRFMATSTSDPGKGHGVS